MANLLLYVILPCAILKSFNMPRSLEKTEVLLVSFALGLIALVLAMAVSALIFRREPLNNFGAAFSNAGFMGIPLIEAAMGTEAVFYCASMIALLNVLQWTYGQAVISGKGQGHTCRNIVKNPLLISLLAGFAIYFLQIPVPSVVSSSINSISMMNAPAAMIILGVYLAQVRFSDIFTDVKLYLVSGVRLLLIPILTVIPLSLFYHRYHDICLALVIAASAPVGANVAVYAQKLEKNYTYAVKMVCLSTIISIVTLPVLVLAAEQIWK
ncbi:AEC family transporter [Blautia producta]